MKVRSSDWVDVALAEYNALRDEIIATLHGQQAILTFGTAAIGVLTAGAFNVWEEPAVIALVFLAVIPLLSGIILVVWVGEFVRRMRAGAHIKRLEDAFRRAHPDMPESVMAWEGGLRSGERADWIRHYNWNYYAVVALFAVIGIGSLVLGAYRGFGYWPWPTVVGAAGEAVALAAMFWFVTLQIRRGRQLRDHHAEEAPPAPGFPFRASGVG